MLPPTFCESTLRVWRYWSLRCENIQSDSSIHSKSKHSHSRSSLVLKFKLFLLFLKCQKKTTCGLDSNDTNNIPAHLAVWFFPSPAFLLVALPASSGSHVSHSLVSPFLASLFLDVPFLSLLPLVSASLSLPERGGGDKTLRKNM
mgnify:CR=1 FL=1